MHKVAHFPIKDFNSLLTCALCQGYLIDATTVVECLHSFCKSCLIKFLERFNTCPRCNTLLHKTRPQYAIRSDHVLQAIVYKLVPRLFENEMNLRREFYSTRPPHERRSLSPEKRGDVTLNTYLPSEDERLSIELEYWRSGEVLGKNSHSPWSPPFPDLSGGHTTYLLCPAGLTIGHLEKLIRLKFELKPGVHDVAVFFSADDCFNSDYTLSDLACLYSWRRQQPMKIYFSVVQVASPPLSNLLLNPKPLTTSASSSSSCSPSSSLTAPMATSVDLSRSSGRSPLSGDVEGGSRSFPPRPVLVDGDLRQMPSVGQQEQQQRMVLTNGWG